MINTQPSPQQMLSGIVAANSHAGRPLLQTSAGLLSLDTNVDLPAGATVTLETLDAPVLPDTVPNPAEPPGTGFQEAIDILRQAGALIASTNPAAMDLPARLTAALFGLSSAADTASIKPWLGERLIRKLNKAGHQSLIDRLEKELRTLKTPVRMPLNGEWQSLMLPLPIDQRIDPIRLVFRRPPDDAEEAAAREDEGTRFLVDVTMSRLGALQIDGLLRRKTKRFDMILRSHVALPEEMRHGIEAIFNRSLEGLNMAGSAMFQHTKTFIEPIPMTEPEISGWVI
ncbi:hypothetical protein CWS72_22440 [Telmatospirillum siberiense]|uniref:Uncharacterized protein n=1 Tax=Telmatospirillum siberiense TaxID=382514 RepID=A0A2N3PPL0_9PROT|nr:hypothetical protein CWS72_22440 [Telmatospirillum siberiense]